MKARVFPVEDGDKLLYYTFRCPACKDSHYFISQPDPDKPEGPVWGFNGDLLDPTVSPSIRVRWDKWNGSKYTPKVCHFFIRDGIIEYCNDCTHDYAGRKHPMEIEEIPDSFSSNSKL